MRKIKYMGPAATVNVGGVGQMRYGEAVDVEDGIAAELLKSVRQRFEAVPAPSGESAARARTSGKAAT